jgi:hypothetical protein
MNSKKVIILIELTLFLALVAAQSFNQPRRTPRNDSMDQQAVQQITDRFQQRELARIFLTNSGTIPRDIRSDLNETGVLHFLAISAGQLLPVIKGIEYLASAAALVTGARFFASLMRCRAAMALAVATYLSLIYGLTGSLMRLLFVDLGHRYICSALVRHQCKRTAQPRRHGLASLAVRVACTAAQEPTLFLLVCLTVTALAGRNLLGDWSFLYASIGAHACVLGAKAAKSICNVVVLKNRPAQWILTLVIIQLFATCAMLPLSSVSILPALLTNLSVAPILGILVIPETVVLSLVIQMGLADCDALAPAIDGIIRIADLGLGWFSGSAQFFASLDSNVRLPMLKPFSTDAYRYTVTVIGLCWFGPQIWSVLRALRAEPPTQLNPSKDRSWISSMIATPSS